MPIHETRVWALARHLLEGGRARYWALKEPTQSARPTPVSLTDDSRLFQGYSHSEFERSPRSRLTMAKKSKSKKRKSKKRPMAKAKRGAAKRIAKKSATKKKARPM